MNRIEPLESRVLLADATLVKDIFAGPDLGALFLNPGAAVENKLIFPATDAQAGLEPWVSDGTPLGTELLANITPSGGSNPSNFIAGGGFVFFTALIGGKTEIVRTDGTPTGTVQVSDVGSASFYGAETPAFVNGKLIFFTRTVGPGNTGSIWRTNANGEQAVIASGAFFPSSTPLGVVGNRLLFSATTDASGTALWATDGNTASLIHEIEPGPTPTTIGPSTLYNGLAYFSARTLAHEHELWVSNGTPAGTKELADINPFFGSSNPTSFAVSDSKLYFVADGGTGVGYQIFQTTGGKPTPVTNVAGTTSSTFRNLTDLSGTLFFSREVNGLLRLHKLVGNTPTLVGSSDGPISTYSLTAVGSTLFFGARPEIAGNDQLYQTDGGAITKVGGAAGIDPRGLTRVGDKLFFCAFASSTGYELHVVAGAPATPPPEELSIAVRANGRTNLTVDEGASVQFNSVLRGATRDQVLKYYWFFDGTSKYEIQGPKPSHIYQDNLPDDAARRVRLKIVLRDKRQANGYIQVYVRNVKPTFTVTRPAEWAIWHPLELNIRVNEPGDEEDLPVLGIDWGDGSPVEVIPVVPGEGLAILKVTHTFKKLSPSGGFPRFFVRDKDQAQSVRKPVFQIKRFISIQTDEGLGYLLGGSGANDTLHFQNGGLDQSGNEQVHIRLNGGLVTTLRYDGGGIGGIPLIAHLGSGNDVIQIDPGIVRVDFEIIGDSGSDTLNGVAIK